MDPNKLQAEIDTYVSRTPKSAQLQKQAEAYDMPDDAELAEGDADGDEDESET